MAISIAGLPAIVTPLISRPSIAIAANTTPLRIALVSSGKPTLYLIEADASPRRALLWNQDTQELGFWTLASLQAAGYVNDGTFVATTLGTKR